MSDSTVDVQVQQISEWLAVLVEPDSTVEMRILSQAGKMQAKFYRSTDLHQMARDALKLGKGAKGVFWLMNPLPAGWSGGSAKDVDIVRRVWLLIDCDPQREGTVSATDAEKEAAKAKAKQVCRFLNGLGWPLPIIADSGNGWHLLYRIDLPADDGKLVARILKVLAAMFSDDAVKIDTKVGNAARICKLYGTIAAKGENTSERPHRVSKIIRIPSPLDVVPTELLQKLASEGEQPPALVTPPQPHPSPDNGERASRSEAVEPARKYLAQMDPSIEGQNGSARLIHAASMLVNDFGLSDTAALNLLQTEFNPRCVPPWDERELSRKISEAQKNSPARPPKGGRSRSNSNRVPDSETREEAIVVRLSDVKEEAVEWLWPNRIPLGKLTLIAGDPGLGKSFMTVNMAARVSTGSSWPDAPATPQPVGSVVLLNCEDDVADTVLPRFRKAGGDPVKAFAIQGIKVVDDSNDNQRERGFSLDRDLPTLIQVLEQHPDTRLVVIDPISAYCGAIDSHKNADVRGLLAPLAAVASKHGVAVVMVTHLSKGTGGKAIYRAMGSIGFAGTARAVWNVVKDNDDPARRLLLMTKANLCVESTGLAYRLLDGAVSWEEAPVKMTSDEHMADEGRKDRKSSDSGPAVIQAAEWLRETLSGGSMLVTDVYELAEESGISRATLKRAKKTAGVESMKVGFGESSVSHWTLPSADTETDVPEE